MSTKTMKNFHVPLPEDLYKKLRLEADRSKRPATELARKAIELWIKQRQKKIRDQQIADYANQYAGTEFDLNKDLENSSIEHLLEDEKDQK